MHDLNHSPSSLPSNMLKEFSRMQFSMLAKEMAEKGKDQSGKTEK